MVGAGIAASLLLAGCVSAPPAPGPAPQMAREAALLDQQAARVTTDTFAQIHAADAGLDVELLGDRIAGDALTVRTAQYKVASSAADNPPDVLPAEMQARYVSAATSWPRMLASVSVQPGDNLTPVVSLWLQDDIATPYSLRAWAHMIPGASMPSMPTDVTGATQLAITDQSVSPSPQAAIEQYVEFLRAGKDSELAASFAPDTYSERLFAAREVLTAAASGAGGAYSDTIEADLANTYVLSTADGGALVFAPVSVTSAFSVTNAKVSVPAADQALVEGTLNDKVTHHYRDLLVMYIPGPAAGTLPGLVAADHHLIKVTPG
jgi:outer membrane murein-binding lipoprotein Lpp